MMDVIEYIRSFFRPASTKRKRCSTEFIEELISPSKHRKLTSCFPEDDWILPSSMIPSRNKRASKPITINLEDEVDATITSNGAKPKAPISSTPNTYKKLFSGMSDANISRSSYFSTSSFNDTFSMPSLNKTGIAKSSAVADFAYRLDEKQKYQQLLNKSCGKNGGTLADSFASYYTPIMKAPFGSRGRHMVDLTNAKSTPVSRLVDLTIGSDGKTQKNKTATSEAIQKVLDDIDDVVVVKDSDSEVEYLPTPPSPKPDIKVEPVNSLKQFASTCEPLKEDWIEDKVRKHRAELNKITSELQTRESKLAEVRRINEEIIREQLEKQVEKCLHIKEVVIPIVEEVKQTFPELTAKQEEMVAFAFDKRVSQNAVLSSKFNLNITRRDMFTLMGLNWLNDEVINFYMELINQRAKLPEWPNAYSFNTFLYPKILKGGQITVQRWTRKFDIFANDYLCVPIHLGVHWCMAIVDLNAKTISYYDSMGKPNPQCTEVIFKYLQEEHLEKKGTPLDTAGWKQQSVRDVPQQMNGSDCGMFSCTYAEFATRNAAFSFTQANMPYLRRKMVVEIMTGQLLIQ